MEFRNVLVYTDGQPEAERAVRVGATLARQSGGALRILHVTGTRVPAGRFGDALGALQEEELERLCKLARELGVEAESEARTGRPFLEILRTVRRTGSDVVIKAARGRGRLGWPLLGSTALHLVRKCPVPVWLVGQSSEPTPRSVMALLASDPGSDARQALDHRVLEVATSLARLTGADASVAAAWDAPGASLLRGRMRADELAEYVEGARREAEEALGRAVEPFAEAINPARVHLVRGVPHEVLVSLAAQRADLVVLGTTPPEAGAGLLIREEAEELVNRLETSILAVKPEGFVSPVEA